MTVAWETAYENLARLPRMYTEPDGSFLWTGETAETAWQLEGTLFDDGQVIRRIELVGNCPTSQWLQFFGALDCNQDSISVESLAHAQVFDGVWLLTQAVNGAAQ
jgi:hypothetical protein